MKIIIQVQFVIYFSTIIIMPCFSQQTDCTNIGFDKGNTSGWKLTYGTVRLSNSKVLFENEQEGIFEDGVKVFSYFDGNDPKITTDAIPTVNQGGNYSVRLGNTEHGGTFDRIQTTFTVDPSRTIFLYKFAVILQDFNNHSTFQKPGFNIKVLDENDNSAACSEFNVQLGTTGTGPLKGFKTQDDVQFLNWTTGAIDLKPYIGKKLKIIVTAHGCTNRRHFGYAYFDAECVKAEIKQLSKCPDKDGFISLKAPDGFGSYVWGDGQISQIVKVKAFKNDKNSVKMLPLFSLQNTCQLGLDHTIQYAKLDTVVNLTICEEEITDIDGEPFNQTGNYVRNIKRSDVCDSTVNLNLTVTKLPRYTLDTKICEGEFVKIGDSTYTKTGNYVTHIFRPYKCDSVVHATILVDKKVIAKTDFDFKIINDGDSLLLHTDFDPTENNSYIWSPPVGLSCSTCPNTWLKPKISQEYIINVTNPNKTCFAADTLYVKVEPCQIHAPDIFTPDNNDSNNNLFHIFGGSCIRIIKSIAIYNRWGELMYFAENFPPSDWQYGWDGTYLGKQLQADVYPYRVIYELKEGKTVDFKSAITLVR